ncbi:MAG: hypothetical protein ACSHXZ_14990 [Gammaproteobacteria bacterium]
MNRPDEDCQQAELRLPTVYAVTADCHSVAGRQCCLCTVEQQGTTTFITTNNEGKTYAI